MTRRSGKPATYADIEALPPQYVGEIMDGELFVSPRPATPHARAATRLGALLDGPFDRSENGPGGWIILDEPELHFGSEVLVPDLAAWRRERMPELPEASHLELPPDWVCEVLSASTATSDRKMKLPIYAGIGVQHAWLIDPLARTLELLRNDGRELVHVETLKAETVRAEPFDAIELQLATLWAR